MFILAIYIRGTVNSSGRDFRAILAFGLRVVSLAGSPSSVQLTCGGAFLDLVLSAGSTRFSTPSVWWQRHTSSVDFSVFSESLCTATSPFVCGVSTVTVSFMFSTVPFTVSTLSRDLSLGIEMGR